MLIERVCMAYLSTCFQRRAGSERVIPYNDKQVKSVIFLSRGDRFFAARTTTISFFTSTCTWSPICTPSCYKEYLGRVTAADVPTLRIFWITTPL